MGNRASEGGSTGWGQFGNVTIGVSLKPALLEVGIAWNIQKAIFVL